MTVSKTPKRARAHASKHAPPKPRKAEAALSDALSEASWAEADQALAEAWRDFAGLEKSLENLTRQANELNAGIVEIEGRFMLASQALLEAGRRRGLRKFGDPGAVERFDARRHDLAAALRKPARKTAYVRVKTPGVARGSETAPIILIRAEADVAPAPSKPSPKAQPKAPQRTPRRASGRR